MHTESQPQESRKDAMAARLVEEGIAMAEQLGRRKAASFMDAEGLPFPVIVRVLDRRACRRLNTVV